MESLRPKTRRGATMRQALGLLALAATQPELACASKLEGQLPFDVPLVMNQGQRWGEYAAYVGKFCFDYNLDTNTSIGKVVVTTTRQGNNFGGKGKLYFMIFDDEKQHWKKMKKLWGKSTCEEKKADASLVTEVDLKDGKHEFTIKIMEHLRPRFWYFTFVACDGLMLAPLRYVIHVSNDNWGAQKEFSLDHMGVYTAYKVFVWLFGLAGIWTCISTRRSDGAGPPMKEHPYIKLLELAYLASIVSCAMFLIHYYFYQKNGHGSLRIRFLGICAGIVTNCAMYLLALLASCGWAISRFDLPCRSLFLGSVSFFGLIYLLCELHAEMMVNQSTQLYTYAGTMGGLLLMLKVFWFCWFAFQTKISCEEESNAKRRTFYQVLGVSVTGWSLCVPITVLLAFQIAPWVRFKVVMIVELVFRFVGLIVFTQLFTGPLSPISSANTFVMEEEVMDDVSNANFGRFSS